MWCCKTRKQTFTFENGTMVRARDPFRAYEILNSISLKDVVEIEETDKGHWMVNFNPNVFIQLQATGMLQARKAAEWAMYLDRREMRIVGAG